MIKEQYNSYAIHAFQIWFKISFNSYSMHAGNVSDFTFKTVFRVIEYMLEEKERDLKFLLRNNIRVILYMLEERG